MAIQFDYSTRRISEILSETVHTIPIEGMTLRQLLGQLDDQGLMLFCIFLTIPFLLPIQIPDLSTVFCLPVAFIAVGLTMNRVPTFPAWLMERRIPSARLVVILEHGARLFARIEQIVRPRWSILTHSAAIKRVTGLLLLLAAGLLMLPLILPFSNFFPTLAILLLAVGILQRDGLFILGGYLAVLGTVVYFVGVALLAIHGAHSIIGML